ncbi:MULTISPECIES: GNAT family N-acetyltransferase [Acutalibacteraceae]|uniref:GNAT family N-acetyltransferase n=1 Tax=Acutalibacteraceae TaxID=3082771 RepID=UPI0013E8F16D|nr:MULTISPECIES: GNAT family N-acetyltransferase [Acutalibacteraceae]
MEHSEKLSIRTADRSDLKDILALYAGAIQKMRDEGIDQWDEIYPDGKMLSADVENRDMLLLVEDGKPVSAVAVNAEQSPEYESVGWRICRAGPPGVIHRLCVSAGAQGGGMGSRTLKAAERFALSRGYRCIRLDAFVKNPQAIRLYESAGYQRAGTVTFRKGAFICYEKLLEGLK